MFIDVRDKSSIEHVMGSDNRDHNMVPDTNSCQITECQADTRPTMLPSSATAIRPKFDVHIIYAPDDNSPEEPPNCVLLLQEKLQESKYTYTSCSDDCLPGKSIMSQQIDLIANADFIICFLSVSPQTREMSKMLKHCV